jgi:hypothetical protein
MPDNEQWIFQKIHENKNYEVFVVLDKFIRICKDCGVRDDRATLEKTLEAIEKQCMFCAIMLKKEIIENEPPKE